MRSRNDCSQGKDFGGKTASATRWHGPTCKVACHPGSDVSSGSAVKRDVSASYSSRISG